MAKSARAAGPLRICIRPEEGLTSQTASAGVIFRSSLLGAPVSTTQVVASVVGIGVGRRRWHHVHWSVGAQHGPRVADHPARVRGARRRGARAVAAGDVTRKRWFLPETPDVLGMLRRQMAVTIHGVEAFVRWAGGDAAAAQAVRDAEHQGDVAKRDLLSALREAFVTPIEPEDLFALARDRPHPQLRHRPREGVRGDGLLPDEWIATMAGLLGDALRHLDDARVATTPAATRPRPRTPPSPPSTSSKPPTTPEWWSCLVSRIARSGSPAASGTAAPHGSARQWSTSPSASSTPSSSKAERGIIPIEVHGRAAVGASAAIPSERD